MSSEYDILHGPLPSPDKQIQLSIAETFLSKTENISLNVAASKIDKELLHKIMEAIMNGSYDENEALKLEIYNAINREL